MKSSCLALGTKTAYDTPPPPPIFHFPIGLPGSAAGGRLTALCHPKRSSSPSSHPRARSGKGAPCARRCALSEKKGGATTTKKKKKIGTVQEVLRPRCIKNTVGKPAAAAAVGGGRENMRGWNKTEGKAAGGRVGGGGSRERGARQGGGRGQGRKCCWLGGTVVCT